MASTLWTGSISFGLVNIPVSLVTAEQRDELDFTLLDKRDSSPIGYQKISKRTGKPVPGDRIVRGSRAANGRYVVLSDADLRRASPERTQRIDILVLRGAPEIAPLYFDRPYYLEPAKRRRAGLRAVPRGAAAQRQGGGRDGGGEDAPASRRDGRAGRGAGAGHPPLRGRAARPLAPPRPRPRAQGGLRPRAEDGGAADGRDDRGMGARAYHDEYHDELLAFIKKRGRAGKRPRHPRRRRSRGAVRGPT